MTAHASSVDVALRPVAADCVHCGLPVPRSRSDDFCCDGCQTVFEVIHGAGLGRYYREREIVPKEPAVVADRGFGELDDPRFLAESTRAVGELREVELWLENLHCPACVWLVERLGRVVPAVASARVDLSHGTVRLLWDPAEAPLSRVAQGLASLGYTPHRAGSGSRAELSRQENRALLVRLAVAGACFANVMLLSVALYSGEASGMEEEWQRFFRIATALVATPAVIFAGSSFFRGAWASLRTRTAHMDLPVSLGISVGFISGMVNVFSGRGDLYFDSVTAVVFLLLIGRTLERRQQSKASSAADVLLSLAPGRARLLEAGEARDVPIESVPVGALLEVRAGDHVPADGVVIEGASSIDTSLLSGEALPEEVGPGAVVHAGTINVSARLVVRAEQTGHSTRIAELGRRVELARLDRAPIARLADRVAGRFVVFTIGLAALTLLAWLALDPSRAIDATIALLVVTCPCALGLATPLAVSSAIGKAARRGILIQGGRALEALAQPCLIVFDKTGTLTLGRLELVSFEGDPALADRVARIEARSAHPVARAFVRALGEGSSDDDIEEFRQFPGGGVEATVSGAAVIIGSIDFVSARAEVPEKIRSQALVEARRGRSPVLVAVDGVTSALACFADPVRPDAAASLAALSAQGHRLAISSGDRTEVAESVAQEIGVPFELVRGGQTPEQKLAFIEQALRRGPVVMVGDGVNDSAALARATVGVAVHGGAEASLAAADVFTTRPGVGAVRELFEGGRRTLSVIRRNLGVSLVYNLVCAGLALSGHISPLVAAILMPLSSLSVVTSSYRSRTFSS